MSMIKTGGAALILAGVSVALWPVTHPWGTITGSDIGQSGQWIVSHTFHFLAAVFGLFGLLGLVEREARTAGWLERSAFALAFMGTILFAGTGVITAFLWPVIAAEAPHLTELHGPIFTPPHPLLVSTGLLYGVGHALLGAALLRAGVIPRWTGGLLILGAVLLLAPPAPIGPLPWILFPMSGVIFGTGLAGLGLSMRV